MDFVMLQNFLYERKVSESMREKRHLDVALEIKSMDESGRFAGYASVFDVVDNQRDVVEKGAFIHTLRNRIAEIKLLWQHQMDEPIGYFTEMFEDERGLYVEGQLLLGVERAREALELLQNGVVKGLSIGYAPRHYVLDPDSGVRRLSEVDLFEVSLVTFPANEVAQVSVVKAGIRDQALGIRRKKSSRKQDMVALEQAIDKMEQVLSSS